MTVSVRRFARMLAPLALVAASLVSVAMSPAQAAPAKLAELTIVSDGGDLGQANSGEDFGHTFLAVKNVSSKEITVGRLEHVAPGETVTVGTWGNKSEHRGVWYNLEAWFLQKAPGTFHDASYLTRPITGEQLSKLNDYIRNNDHHGGGLPGALWDNCSSWATGAWNGLFSWEHWILAAIPPGVPTPAGAKYYIDQNGAHKVGFTLPWSGRGVHYANGKKATKASTTYIVKTTEPDPGGITSDIVGSGVSVVESETQGSAEQWSHVDGMAGSSSVWVLSTGRAAEAVGTPDFEASTPLGGAGNEALTALAGYQTYDASSYRVRLKPAGSTLHIRYVFASEEYPEFVNSSYNDVMAVFVNGTNCATVPGTTEAVSINTVNAQRHSEWYVDNTSGASGYQTSFDGLTKPLECTVPVTPGVPVDVEIAVADVSDGILDSGVAILDKGIWSD